MEIARYLSSPVQAVRVTHSDVRAIAEWIAGPGGRLGYLFYGDSPVKFRTPDGQMNVDPDSWIVKIGESFVNVPAADFDQTFHEVKDDPPVTEA